PQLTHISLFSSLYAAPLSHLLSFPTRRSSDLADPALSPGPGRLPRRRLHASVRRVGGWRDAASTHDRQVECRIGRAPERGSDRLDRKSTRLNFSHVKISYAVFCLKKKKKKEIK